MAANGDQTKDIDSRILKILGLSDAVDLEYGEYKTLLKEKMLAQRMQGGGDSGDAKLITDEYKSIKNEKGKFKARSVGNAKDFVSGKKGGSSATHRPQRDSSKLLPGSGGGALSNTDLKEEEEVGEESEAEDFMRNVVAPSLSKIEKSLENILNSFKKQQDLDEKASEKDRVGEEKDKKKEREAKLESKDGPIKKTLDIVSKPVKGFFDMIWDFLKNVLLGGALLGLVNIFKNPSAFFNPIIEFANGVIGFLNLVIDILSHSMLWPINSALTALNLGIKGIESAINGVLNLFGSDTSVDLGEGYKPIAFPNIPTIPLMESPTQGLEGGGEIVNVNNISFTGGGGIDASSGITISGMGKDTQLIAAQPGESVMQVGARERQIESTGIDPLSFNVGPNANKPKMGTPVLGASSGGMIQGFEGGGRVATMHPYLTKMNDENIKKSSAPWGRCVTGSLNTMLSSGVPEPAGTSADVGNNARGAMVQMIKDFGWKSTGGTSTTLDSPYGKVQAGVYSKSAYDSQVKSGKVPSGALIFQTRHDSWNGTSPNSSGYDMSIAQQNGKSLWNGNLMGQWVHSNPKKVVVLTPDGKAGDGKVSTPAEISKSSNSSGGDIRPPGPSGGGGGGGNTAVIGGGKQQGGASSGSSASQKSTPSISSQDINNAELIVIKSIYNIIG